MCDVARVNVPALVALLQEIEHRLLTPSALAAAEGVAEEAVIRGELSTLLASEDDHTRQVAEFIAQQFESSTRRDRLRSTGSSGRPPPASRNPSSSNYAPSFDVGADDGVVAAGSAGSGTMHVSSTTGVATVHHHHHDRASSRNAGGSTTGGGGSGGGGGGGGATSSNTNGAAAVAASTSSSSALSSRASGASARSTGRSSRGAAEVGGKALGAIVTGAEPSGGGGGGVGGGIERMSTNPSPSSTADSALELQETPLQAAQRLCAPILGSPMMMSGATMVELERHAKRFGTWDLDVIALDRLLGGSSLAFVSTLALEATGALELAHAAVGPLPPMFVFSEEEGLDAVTGGSFRIRRKTLGAFLRKMEDGYREHRNPFHNDLHAADIAHTTLCLLRSPHYAGLFAKQHIAGTVLSAIVHDFRHPGVNNAFLVNTGHDLAIRYNDRSVLENFHIAETFRVLHDPQCDVLECAPRTMREEIRSLMIDNVLATDMQRHFELIETFRTVAAEARRALLPPDGLKYLEPQMPVGAFSPSATGDSTADVQKKGVSAHGLRRVVTMAGNTAKGAANAAAAAAAAGGGASATTATSAGRQLRQSGSGGAASFGKRWEVERWRVVLEPSLSVAMSNGNERVNPRAARPLPDAVGLTLTSGGGGGGGGTDGTTDAAAGDGTNGSTTPLGGPVAPLTPVRRVSPSPAVGKVDGPSPRVAPLPLGRAAPPAFLLSPSNTSSGQHLARPTMPVIFDATGLSFGPDKPAATVRTSSGNSAVDADTAGLTAGGGGSPNSGSGGGKGKTLARIHTFVDHGDGRRRLGLARASTAVSLNYSSRLMPRKHQSRRGLSDALVPAAIVPKDASSESAEEQQPPAVPPSKDSAKPSPPQPTLRSSVTPPLPRASAAPSNGSRPAGVATRISFAPQKGDAAREIAAASGSGGMDRFGAFWTPPEGWLIPVLRPHRRFLLSATVHAADISNPAKPRSIALQWARMVMAEFYAQGDKERDLGIPISPNCDRTNPNDAQCQLGFIAFIIEPTFETISILHPHVSTAIRRHLGANKIGYEARVAHQKRDGPLLAASAAAPTTSSDSFRAALLHPPRQMRQGSSGFLPLDGAVVVEDEDGDILEDDDEDGDNDHGAEGTASVGIHSGPPSDRSLPAHD